MEQDVNDTIVDPGVVIGDDGLARPTWAAVDPLLRDYYDTVQPSVRYNSFRVPSAPAPHYRRGITRSNLA